MSTPARSFFLQSKAGCTRSVGGVLRLFLYMVVCFDLNLNARCSTSAGLAKLCEAHQPDSAHCSATTQYPIPAAAPSHLCPMPGWHLPVPASLPCSHTAHCWRPSHLRLCPCVCVFVCMSDCVCDFLSLHVCVCLHLCRVSWTWKSWRRAAHWRCGLCCAVL